MSYILDDYNTRAHANKKQARLDLEEEAHLIVVAGRLAVQFIVYRHTHC